MVALHCNGNRQENLYATYQTAGPDFWKNLARECQEEFKRFGSEGKCIEAREFIIALPENYTGFDTDGIYHPTKKIGKNNPKADGIRADNETRQDWHRTADMALVVGVPEDEIPEVKQEQIHDKTAASIRAHGWLPGLFRSIVQKAKSFLDGLIRQREVTPKPTLTIDMADFTTMQNLMAQLRRRARVAKEIQEIRIPQLKAQLAEAKGLFKGKERKAIEAQITETEKEVRSLKGEIFGLVEQAGYPDGQAFLTAYNKAEHRPAVSAGHGSMEAKS